DKSNIRNLVNVVKMIDKDTLLIRYYNTIIIYDLKSKKSDCIDLKDYPDMESFLDEKVEYNYYNGFLDVYTNEIGSELTVYRIDMAKEEVVQNKTFECEIYYPEYFEDYILLTKNEKHYIVDRNTLEIKFDFSELETEKGSINKYTSSGYRKAAGVYIIDNKAYLLSDNGIKQVDLEKGDVRQLQCTKEMSIKSVYLLDDILYTVTEDALYKININSDNISKLTDIEGTMTSIDKFYMYSHDRGYLMFNYDKGEYEGFIFIYNE
nr:hypothetical protein [Lachnospiraceae bacterium]